jgi:3-oxoadipate enol-lactonase
MKTILLLHGFPLSSAMWGPQRETLAGRYRLVCPDARGFGGTDAGTGPLSMEQIARDAAAALDAAGEEKAVVGGCSMGGYAAFAFYRAFPQRVRALILVDTKASADTEEARTGRKALADKVLAQGAAAVADAMMPKLLGPSSHRDRPELVARVREWILAAPPPAIANALLGLGARPDSRPELAQVTVPTLLVRGDEDAIISESDVREMQQGITGSRSVAIPAAGHLPNLEQPAAFDAALRGFLDGLPG